MRYLILVLLMFSVSVFAVEVSPQDKQDFEKAKKMIGGKQLDDGFKLVKRIIQRNIGDIELSRDLLAYIMNESYRDNLYDEWTDYGVGRILALRDAGLLNSYDGNVRRALELKIQNCMRTGQLIAADEAFDQLIEIDDISLVWRSYKASFYKNINSSKARQMYQDVLNEIDQSYLDDNYKSLRSNIVRAIREIDKGAVLAEEAPTMLELMDSNLNREWQAIAHNNPAGITELINAMIYQSVYTEPIAPLRNNAGAVNPWQVLDNHLLKQKKADLRALHKMQNDGSFAKTPADFTKASTDELMLLYYQYPWSDAAHKGLLTLASRALWNGEIHSAIRSYLDVLNHSVNKSLRDQAQVGYWLALSQLDDKRAFHGAISKADKKQQYPWMNGKATVSQIQQAIEKASNFKQEKAAGPLKNMKVYRLRSPSTLPWPISPELSAPGPMQLELDVSDDLVMMSSRNMLIAYNKQNLNKALWSKVQTNYERSNIKGLPGPYQVQVKNNTVYYRWGYQPGTTHLTAMNAKTAKPVFTSAPEMIKPANKNDHYSLRRHQRFYQFICSSPLIVGDNMYYLQLEGDEHFKTNNKAMYLVCRSQTDGKLKWRSEVIRATKVSDASGTFSKADLNMALFSNKVTISDGAIYCMGDAGFVAKCDIRNGRMEWIHYYKSVRTDHRKMGNIYPLGGSPIVKGDMVFCTPRDSGLVFALDKLNGKQVWENPLIIPVQQVGIHKDDLIIKGISSLVSLDSRTGKIKWHRRMDNNIVGRAHLIHDSIFLGHTNAVSRYNAATGVEQERLNLGKETIFNYTIKNNELFVVTDEILIPNGVGIGEAINPDAPANAKNVSLPLKPTWSLDRENTRVLSPPENSQLKNKIFSITNGILECFEMSAKGKILWQRFVSPNYTNVRFYQNKILLHYYSRSNPGRRELGSNYIICIDGNSGKMLWRNDFSDSDLKLYTHGNVLAVATRYNISLIDVNSGKLIATKGPAVKENYSYKLAQKGDTIHAFSISYSEGLFHRSLNLKTGVLSPAKQILKMERIQLYETMFVKGKVLILMKDNHNRQMEYSYDLNSNQAKSIRENRDWLKPWNTHDSKYLNPTAYNIYRNKQEMAIYRTDDDNYEYKYRNNRLSRARIYGDTLFLEVHNAYEIHDLKQKRKIFQMDRKNRIREAMIANGKIFVIQDIRSEGLNLVTYDMKGKMLNKQAVSNNLFQDKKNRSNILGAINQQVLMTADKGGIRAWVHNPDNQVKVQTVESFVKYLEDKNRWKLQASINDGNLRHIIDGKNDNNRWDSGVGQKPGVWVTVQLPKSYDINGIVLDSKNSGGDYPRGVDVYVSNNGKQWDKVTSASGSKPVIEITFKEVRTRFIKVQLNKKHEANWWSIHEIDLLQKDKKK